MRICLATTSFLPLVGGAEKMADALAGNLSSRGHHTIVLAQKTPDPIPPRPYPVYTYPRPPKQNWWPEILALHLHKLKKKSPFDVILAFDSYPLGYAAVWAKKKLGVAVAITPRGGDLYVENTALNRLRIQTCRSRGYQGANRIISISPWLTQRIRETAGPNLPPIDEVPNGIDLASFDQRLAALKHLDHSWATQAGIRRPFMLHLARVTSIKRQSLAVQAIARLAPLFRQRGFQYVIAGDGRQLPDLQTQVAQAAIEDVILTIGQRTGTEKDWLLQNASCMVTTSAQEGFPNVLLEAMAAGLPVLASDIPIHQQLLTQQNWGMTFKTDDVDHLTTCLQHFLQTDLAPWSAAALQLRSQYDLSRTIDAYEQSLLACLSS